MFRKDVLTFPKAGAFGIVIKSSEVFKLQIGKTLHVHPPIIFITIFRLQLVVVTIISCHNIVTL